MTNQFLVDAVCGVKCIIAETRLVGYNVGDSLRVLPRHNRVVDHEVVQRVGRVLEKELSQLDAIRERIERHLDSFCNRNKLILFILDPMRAVGGDRFKNLGEILVSLEVRLADPTGLHVEKLGRVENGLGLCPV